MQFLTKLKSSRGKATSEVLDEGDIRSSHEFYKSLPSAGASTRPSPDDPFDTCMFKLSDESGKMKFTKVSKRRQRLEHTCVYARVFKARG